MQTASATRRGSRAIALAAVALAGFAFSFTPLSGSLDNAALDLQWRVLRKVESRPSADGVVLVGIDDASLDALPDPPPLWHAAIGRALERVASAGPRAIALDLPLPERSFDNVRAGLDAALFAGLAQAVRNTPFVAVLTVDPATRGVRRIHTPYLALLGDKRLALGLQATDADGVARRFSLEVPTEDGGFPTLVGRMCAQLKRTCSEGLIDYGLGEPILAVPLKNVLTMQDEALFARLFHDKVVLIGQTRRFADRIAVPWNPAAWEPGGGDTPGVVLHAQTLRTALARAPSEPSRPMQLVLASLAALLVLGRGRGLLALTGLLVAAAAFIVSTLALRAGYHLPLGTLVFTLVLAWVVRVLADRSAAAMPKITRSA